MATAKAILNTKYKGKDGQYPIVIRLINGLDQKNHPLKYRIKKKYWDNGQVSDDHPEAEIINSVIDEELLKAKRYFADCRIKELPIDLDLVFTGIKSHSFTGYLKHRARQHDQADQLEMKLKVERYIKELTTCFQKEQIYFSEVTQDFLRTFDSWLAKADPEIGKVKNVNNTRAKKFEFLGKYYQNAITEGKAKAPNPFKAYKIKATPVKKEKLTREQLTAIENLPLQPGKLKLARDLFLFSYYCKGARFETCITMQKSAIKKDRLHFQINKGLKYLSVPLHAKLKAIIDDYVGNDSPYIFGRIATDFEMFQANKKLKRSKLGSENYMINRDLKMVAAMAEIDIPLSMHHARHSLAFHLKQASGNIGAIQDILGHSRSQITETYLKSLDDEYLDKELEKVYG